MQFTITNNFHDAMLYVGLNDVVAVTNHDDFKKMELHLSSGHTITVSNERLPNVLEALNSR